MKLINYLSIPKLQRWDEITCSLPNTKTFPESVLISRLLNTKELSQLRLESRYSHLLYKYISKHLLNDNFVPAFMCYFYPSMAVNHMSSKVRDEITYPFPNFNGATVEDWENYLSIPKLQRCNRWSLGMDK